ncbi:MAG: hypothetical protein IKK17_02310 [Oscillospiraceae bacterium]|nr:hypothetical protein [Oscillospiraceae bacterium]
MFENFIQSASIAGSLLITLFSGALFLYLVSTLANGLFRVGRTEAELSELLGKYSFRERLFLEHVLKDSDFADEFCVFLAIYYNLGVAIIWAELLLCLPALFMDTLRMVMASGAVAMVLLFYVPALIFHLYLSQFQTEE